MRDALLPFLILLGYAAFLFLLFLSIAAIFTKRFSKFWRLCFYLCSVALLALMAVLPLTYTPGGINDDFANNSLLFWPLSTACSVLALVAFKKPQRYFVLFAVLLSIVAFICYASTLHSPRRPRIEAAIKLKARLVGKSVKLLPVLQVTDYPVYQELTQTGSCRSGFFEGAAVFSVSWTQRVSSSISVFRRYFSWPA